MTINDAAQLPGHYGHLQISHPLPASCGRLCRPFPEPSILGASSMNADDNTVFPEPVKIPLEDWLDLHSFPPAEIADLLEEYLSECEKAGLCKVRIIHGKGTGVLRMRVHECLQQNPLVERFYPAPSGAGGWGATIAVLSRSSRRMNRSFGSDSPS